MHQTFKQISKNNVLVLRYNDAKEIPTACQYRNLCPNDVHRVQNESSRWLRELSDHKPIWSRLKLYNCLGQPRNFLLNNMKNYEAEIPGRLVSLFGSEQLQNQEGKSLKALENYYLITCALALCSFLSYNIMEWSAQLLDYIILKTLQIYPEILKKFKITDKQFNMSHLNQFLQFQGIDYEIKQQQVAIGYLYMPYGFNEYNLARALTWFFRYYQFGIIQCSNRTLAFGFTLDSEYGFFMYDCQTRGFPLFKDEQFNSYVLRTNHLQILLYCMIVTFNVSMERTKFFIYNVDVRVINPLENVKLKREIYVPTITSSDTKKAIENKVDFALNNKKIEQNETEHKRSVKIFKESDKNSIKNENFLKSFKTNQHFNDKEIIVNDKTTIKEISKKNPLDKPKSKIRQKPLISKSIKNLKKSKNMEKKPLKSAATNNSLSSKNCDDSTKKIPIEPNKRYYIIAVPRMSRTKITTLPPKNDVASSSKEPAFEKVKVNIQRLTTVKPTQNENSPTLKLLQKDEMEIDLEKSKSTLTLTNELVNNKDKPRDSNPLGLKVYLINNRKKCGLPH